MVLEKEVQDLSSALASNSQKEIDQATDSVDALSLEAPKRRKAQLEESFQANLQSYRERGPLLNTQDGLFDETRLANLDNSQKLDRVFILNACEKAYFQRNYTKCLELIAVGERLFGTTLEDADTLKLEFSSAGKKTKKSSKVERHVMELLKIKEACLRRMDSE